MTIRDPNLERMRDYPDFAELGIRIQQFMHHQRTSLDQSGPDFRAFGNLMSGGFFFSDDTANGLVSGLLAPIGYPYGFVRYVADTLDGKRMREFSAEEIRVGPAIIANIHQQYSNPSFSSKIGDYFQAIGTAWSASGGNFFERISNFLGNLGNLDRYVATMRQIRTVNASYDALIQHGFEPTEVTLLTGIRMEGGRRVVAFAPAYMDPGERVDYLNAAAARGLSPALSEEYRSSQSTGTLISLGLTAYVMQARVKSVAGATARSAAGAVASVLDPLHGLSAGSREAIARLSAGAAARQADDLAQAIAGRAQSDFPGVKHTAEHYGQAARHLEEAAARQASTGGHIRTALQSGARGGFRLTGALLGTAFRGAGVVAGVPDILGDLNAVTEANNNCDTPAKVAHVVLASISAFGMGNMAYGNFLIAGVTVPVRWLAHAGFEAFGVDVNQDNIQRELALLFDSYVTPGHFQRATAQDILHALRTRQGPLYQELLKLNELPGNDRHPRGSYQTHSGYLGLIEREVVESHQTLASAFVLPLAIQQAIRSTLPYDQGTERLYFPLPESMRRSQYSAEDILTDLGNQGPLYVRISGLISDTQQRDRLIQAISQDAQHQLNQQVLQYAGPQHLQRAFDTINTVYQPSESLRRQFAQVASLDASLFAIPDSNSPLWLVHQLRISDQIGVILRRDEAVRAQRCGIEPPAPAAADPHPRADATGQSNTAMLAVLEAGGVRIPFGVSAEAPVAAASTGTAFNAPTTSASLAVESVRGGQPLHPVHTQASAVAAVVAAIG